MGYPTACRDILGAKSGYLIIDLRISHQSTTIDEEVTSLQGVCIGESANFSSADEGGYYS